MSGKISAKDQDYPKVLVVNGFPFGDASATSLTMSSLFKGWPSNRLACIYTDPYTSPDVSFCEYNWYLGRNGIKLFSPKQSYNKLSSTDKNLEHEKINATNSSSWKSNLMKTTWFKYLRRIKLMIPRQGVRDLFNYKISAQLAEVIDDFNPEIIYTMLGSRPMIQLCRDIVDIKQLPLIIHFMDDWPATLYKRSVLRLYLRPALKNGLDNLLKRSKYRLTIGDAMAEEFSHRYGGEYLSFMNSVEEQILREPPKLPEEKASIQFIYIGGLHLKRWTSLLKIGRALDSINNEGFRLRCLIYTNPRYAGEAKLLSKSSSIDIKGSIQKQDIHVALSNSDIAIHVESFDKHNRQFTKYSISTKIPECMAAARPILAFGPRELASMAYIERVGCGIVVGEESDTLLINAIKEMIQSHSLRLSLARRGYLAAKENHNASIERNRFRHILLSAANECD